MATMLENLRDLVSPALVSAFSQKTGESQVAVSRGFSAALPAIASAIANRADDLGFMTNLSELATKTAAVPNPPEGISAIASSPTGLDTTTPIGGWLSSLFGHNVFDVTDSIGRYAGMSGSSAASLLSIAAPLVLGYIGRLIRSDKLTITGLSDLFRGQRAQLAASLPTGFKMSGVGAPYETRRRALKETASTGWSAPLLALLAALGIGGLIWWGRQKPVDIARVDIVEVEPMSKAVGTSGTLPTFSRTLPGNVVITMPPGSAEDRLSMYLASALPGVTTFNFDRIGFDNNSAVLTAESSDQLDNIATILRAYPRANVAIGGHTDNVGSDASNLELSRARASAVAARLTSAGVSKERVHAEGYGSEKPMADNSTEAGRAQNRRVELVVAVR